MKEKILKKGVLLPLIIGIVLAIAFSVFLQSTDIFKPVSDGVVLAYHDDIGADADVVERDRLGDYKPNDVLGSITADDESIVVRYKADYANTASSLSLENGVEFGKGVCYVEANYSIVDKLLNADKLVYSGAFGEHKYRYVDTKEYPSKQALYNAENDVNKGMVFIYRTVTGYGLSSNYTALIFEEVA